MNLAVNSNRITPGQGPDPRDKLQLLFEEKWLQKRNLVAASEKKGGSESPLLIEQWRIDTVKELKNNSTGGKKKQLEIYLPRQTSVTRSDKHSWETWPP